MSSILYQNAAGARRKETDEPPAFFADLNLDTLIDAITAAKQEYNLKPLYYSSLDDAEEIYYRHEAMRDLENETLLTAVKSFAQKFRSMRECLERKEKFHYKYQKERLFLDAVEIYCDAVTGLARNLALIHLNSRGFSAFRRYLIDYANSDDFKRLTDETQKLLAGLSSIKYCLKIQCNAITVSKYEPLPDYSAAVEKTFEKFKEAAPTDYTLKFSDSPELNGVEARILELVAGIYPAVFSALGDYCLKNAGYLDETIGVFDREVQFYIAYIEFMAPLKKAGLHFCYPMVSKRCREIISREGFDMALAYKLVGENSPVVSNDFYLKDGERIFVVSGPNQGGKTTFARAFGQLHHMASLGCPVAGVEARLLLCDAIFTHFEKEESVKDLSGKLQDELIRIRAVLKRATPDSIIIMNEIFTSTTLNDAIFLGKKIMEKIIGLDSLAVCVTFIDELAALSDKIVSAVSVVEPGNPAARTYKIERRPADGLSYAMVIAEKYRLTYRCLMERIK